MQLLSAPNSICTDSQREGNPGLKLQTHCWRECFSSIKDMSALPWYWGVLIVQEHTCTPFILTAVRTSYHSLLWVLVRLPLWLYLRLDGRLTWRSVFLCLHFNSTLACLTFLFLPTERRCDRIGAPSYFGRYRERSGVGIKCGHHYNYQRPRWNQKKLWYFTQRAPHSQTCLPLP